MCTLASSRDWQEWASGPNSWCWCHDIRTVPRVNFCQLQPDHRGYMLICGCSALGVLLQWIFPRCNLGVPCPGSWWSKACQAGTCLWGAHLTQPKSLLYTYIFTLGGFDVSYTITEDRVNTGREFASSWQLLSADKGVPPSSWDHFWTMTIDKCS